MNPENQQNPNFDWMDWIFLPIKKSELNKIWEKGKISYPENPLLEELVKMEEYHLEAFLPDFRFMGYVFSDWIKHEKKGKKLKKDMLPEELKALKFFNENQDIEIKIKSLDKKESISIKNPVLIDVMYKSLIEFFMKHDKQYNQYDKYCLNRINPDFINFDFDYWGEYLNLRYSKFKASNKGRKIESIALYKIVYLLQKYLQEFTEIKAEAGAKYSNKQARFIFSFLEIHGLIDNLIEKLSNTSNKETIILHYLESYREKNHAK